MSSLHPKFRYLNWKVHLRMKVHLCLVDDNTNPTTPSMNELQQELGKKNAQIESLKKKWKSTQQKSRRLKRKLTSPKDNVKSLKQHHFISTNCEEMLNQTSTAVSLALMKRMTAKSLEREEDTHQSSIRLH